MRDAVQELSQPDNDLQAACSYLDVDLAAKAIAAGANVNMAEKRGNSVPSSPGSLTGMTINPNDVRDFEDVPPLVCPCAQNVEKDVSRLDATLLKACKKLDVAVVRKAIESGANPNVLVADMDGGTPLLDAIIAISYRDLDEPDARERGIQIVSLLLDAGADPNIPHCEHVDCSVYGGKWIGTTPLKHAAWLSKDVELSKMLLEHGANPNFLSSSIRGETIMDLNGLDCRPNEPEFDESWFAKPIEILLASYGGCRRHIFEDDSVEGLSDEDAALVYACQRMDYGAVQTAVKLGGNLNLRQWGSRILPEVTLYDAPQVRGNWFRKNGWQIEQGVVDFILFLLVGMKFPLSEHDADDILTACVYNGYEELLKVLLEHPALGALFRARGGLMKRDTFPWTCWRRGKRRRMAKLLAGEGINFRIQMNDVYRDEDEIGR